MSAKPPSGLTAGRIEDPRRRPRSNRPSRSVRLPYAQIVSRNLFTLFNAIVVPAAILLVILGDSRGAIAVSGMAAVNTAVGLSQEVVTKRRLERLVILAEPRARALREGRVREIPAGEVVPGDQISLAAGDLVVADGVLVEARSLEMDEALLTGESDPVRRQEGDNLLAGSVCVSGEGTYRVDHVGDETYANRLASQARDYRYVASPLTRAIDRVIGWLSLTAIGLAALSVGLYFLHDLSKTESVRMVAATITSMVPQGMVLTATVAFTLGAVRLAGRGALVQRLSAVESMASVDVLCMDKTGTLTTNRLRLDRVHVPEGGLPETDVRARLRLFASASADRRDRGLRALRDALGEVAAERLDQIPFQARNRYSAVRVRDGDSERVLVLGAYESLRGQIEGPAVERWESDWARLLPTGLRLMLFAEAIECGPLSDSLKGVRLRPLALVGLSDELRPGVVRVLEDLAGQGITLKIISGDNPETVRATVVDLSHRIGRGRVLSGEELEAAVEPAELIRTVSVFGRVSPDQKALILRSLQQSGHHVAMIGDGVNDVLSIKRADLGIALGEGSQASKAVAGLVLANNDFAVLPEALGEGRVIVRNLRRSCKLFLVKNVYSLVMIVALFPGLLGLHYPYLPQQVTLLNSLSIGLPAVAIALSRGRASGGHRTPFLHEVGWFALRTGTLFGGAGLLVIWLSVHAWGEALQAQRSILLSVLVLLGMTAMIRALSDGEARPLGAEPRFHALAAVCVSLYLAVMYWPPSADFFRLTPLSPPQWGRVLGVVIPVYALSLLTDRGRPRDVGRRRDGGRETGSAG
jgi:cation-transporting ATPase E